MNINSVDPSLENLATNTIRMLSVDAIQKANSGHPGMPMGAADMAMVLWSRYLRFDPADPNWEGRDRFLLSAGHGSMLQYALLHLFGFDLPLDEIKRFRQLNSKTPGHPEYGLTPGVELTTGPLGQGFANGVGMALAAKLVQSRFEKDGFCPMGRRVFGIVSDGDLMEGISYEAASIAGHWKLGNLVYLYDSNSITIEGATDLSFSENIKTRFDAAGWDTHLVADGHNHESIADAIQNATDCLDKPSLIICRTHIAYGSPNKQDTSDSHGAPLGPDEVTATKKALGWPESPEFYIPENVCKLFVELAKRKTNQRKAWDKKFAGWKNNNTDLAQQWEKWVNDDIPDDLLESMMAKLPDSAAATRALSGAVLQEASARVPNLFGGSADLSPSNKTDIKGATAINNGDFSGKNIHFGIREHAMGAIANGMALSGCIRPYTGTFLVFADYMRPSMRMAALMKLPVIFVFTHDSFWVGEDGPTHQPVEHVASLRLIPNLAVLRPADGEETAIAWDMALRRKDGPSAIILTRQKLEPFGRPAGYTPELANKGGYLISDSQNPDCKNILMASGSEVSMSVQAQKILKDKGVDTKVVSVICLESFFKQPKEYQNQIVSPDAENVFWVEAGFDPHGYRFVKGKGFVYGLDDFGASAPGKELAEYFGYTPEKLAGKILDALK